MTHNQHVTQLPCRPTCPPTCRTASISYKQHQHAYQQVAQLACYSASMSLSSNVVIIDEASTPITYHTPTNLTFPRRTIKLITAKTKHFARTRTTLARPTCIQHVAQLAHNMHPACSTTIVKNDQHAHQHVPQPEYRASNTNKLSSMTHNQHATEPACRSSMLTSMSPSMPTSVSHNQHSIQSAPTCLPA